MFDKFCFDDHPYADWGGLINRLHSMSNEHRRLERERVFFFFGGGEQQYSFFEAKPHYKMSYYYALLG